MPFTCFEHLKTRMAEVLFLRMLFDDVSSRLQARSRCLLYFIIELETLVAAKRQQLSAVKMFAWKRGIGVHRKREEIRYLNELAMISPMFDKQSSISGIPRMA